MSSDLVFIHDDVLSNVADAIRFVEGTTAGIAPEDYANRIRAIDKHIPQPDVLNFYMPDGGTINLNKIGSPTVVELEYSIDRGSTWTVWQENANGNRSLVLTAGQRMYIRNTSDTQTRFSVNSNNLYQFAFIGTVVAYGNTNSLLCKIPNVVTALSNYCFMSLFGSCTSLTTAPELPATTLKDYCYYSMFYGCTSLTTAPPELPATTLTTHCYNSMFYGCTSLTTAPELPATTLAHGCYNSMFNGCTSLTTAPELPATTLKDYCYYRMFYGCTSLATIQTMMTDITADGCLVSWVSNVSPAGDFYCPAELTIPTGSSGIPSNWTRHDI